MTVIRKPSLEDGLTYQELQTYFQSETLTTQLESPEGVKSTQLLANPGNRATSDPAYNFTRLPTRRGLEEVLGAPVRHFKKTLTLNLSSHKLY